MTPPPRFREPATSRALHGDRRGPRTQNVGNHTCRKALRRCFLRRWVEHRNRQDFQREATKRGPFGAVTKELRSSGAWGRRQLVGVPQCFRGRAPAPQRAQHRLGQLEHLERFERRQGHHRGRLRHGRAAHPRRGRGPWEEGRSICGTARGLERASTRPPMRAPGRLRCRSMEGSPGSGPWDTRRAWRSRFQHRSRRKTRSHKHRRAELGIGRVSVPRARLFVRKPLFHVPGR